MLSTELSRAALKVGDRYLVWRTPIDRLSIVERRAERTVRGAVNFVLLVFGVVAAAFFGWLLLSSGPLVVLNADFWLKTGSWYTTVFLISLWADAYLGYRIVKESEAFGVVRRQKYGEGEADAPQEVEWSEVERAAAAKKDDVARTYTAEAVEAVETAFELAAKFGHGRVAPIHLLGGLVSTPSIGLLMARLSIGGAPMKERIERALGGEAGADGPLRFSPEAVRALFDAYLEASRARQSRVRPTEVLLALVRPAGIVQEIFLDLACPPEKVENAAAWIRVATELRERWHAGRKRASFRPKGPVNRAMTSLATPYLDRLSDDLTSFALAGYLPPFVERDDLVTRVFRVLEGGGRPVLLVGPHGTGKEALLFGIAQRMVEEDVPQVLSDKRLIALSVPKVVAGATPSEAAERLENVFAEARRAGNVVLAIHNIHGLIGISAGGGRSIDLSDVVADGLQKYGLLAIATTTPEDDAAAVQRSAVGQTFERVPVDEPDTNSAIRILEAKAGAIEHQNKVYFSYDAVEKAVVLSERYMHERALPEKAIEVLKEVANAVRGSRGEKAVVTGDDVAALVSEKAKVPVTAVTQDEGAKLLNLEEEMHRRMVGQDEAVSAVARAIRRARAELRSVNRPIANFLFLGPTGVGKTELAKTVAETYFGSEEAMVRLDMSEYQDAQAMYRLVGVPGSGQGGLLTEAVRTRPFALLLLDELEKASPEVLNAFLQVMDDGRLTDAAGRTVDFTNVVLVATSNAGAQFIQDGIRQNRTLDDMRQELMDKELRPHFRPEFLNRFDGIILFRPLTEDEIREVARRMLVGVAKQLSEKGITLQVSEDAVVELAAAGFDPVFGARPLRRVIQERVQDALAEFLLSNKISRRDTVVFGAGGQITVNKAPAV
ncbi:ATP-dependent Clp protease ATP-binding subunit [Patescibacteria group bacterium]|nr:MAG: ATP-dependent Clp protease ATP-binding subunit [Patescibacteria group bacterium]